MDENLPDVVIVDDEPSIREASKVLLAKEGFTVHTFATPTEVLKAHLQPPSCFVIDIDLPGMTGEQLYHVLQKRFPHVPCVFITGHEWNLGDKSANLILRKPFRFSTLATAIRDIVGMRP